METISVTSKLMLAVVAMVFVSTLTGCANPAAKLRGEGLALYSGNAYEPALEKFNAALKYDEFEPRANYYAGAIHEKLGHYEQAEYHLKLAWQADPGFGNVKDALTETLLLEGKEDGALDFLERDAALTAKVADPRPEKNGKRPYTKQVEERMFLNKGGDRLRVAKTYEKIGDMENAKINYAKALKMAPNNADYFLAAANFYVKIGDHAAADAAFHRAYRIDPATPGLVDAMTKAGVAISGG